MVDATRVGLEGHSRWGKATAVAMAYDPRFAIAYVSSSGEGGTKINRRDYGEVVENAAWWEAYHWYASNFIKYGGPLTGKDLPVDGHELIALAAPDIYRRGFDHRRTDGRWLCRSAWNVHGRGRRGSGL